jgi:hypothetical protein
MGTVYTVLLFSAILPYFARLLSAEDQIVPSLPVESGVTSFPFLEYNWSVIHFPNQRYDAGSF